MSYARLFEPWGWSIGTGVYTDDIDQNFEQRALELLTIFLILMVVASAVTYFVVHDLLLAMRRVSTRISTLTNGELIGDIPDVSRRDEVGVIARALLVLRDTSREVSELKLDHLTGLPTRKLLMDRIRQSKVRSARSGMVNALILLDLDKFKPLNDAHGHDAGDKLLKEVAVRLSKAVREIDTVARLGGDEFVVLLVDLDEDAKKAKDIAAKIGEKIISALNQDYYLGHIVHHCSASIGVTMFVGKSVSADDLLKQADIAMYKSKLMGSAGCHFFEEEDPETSADQNNFERDLSDGLSSGQFILHFQPQLSSDGKLLGCESLLRWQHPTRGLLKPGDFLSLAEKKGFMSPLGNIALELACQQVSGWSQNLDLVNLRIAVNVSASHFRRAEFVENLLEIIQRARIHPGHLVLELSEHVLANNIPIVIEKMMALRTLGVGFSIDDFGSGYSPLSHLSQLPIQEIKLCPNIVQHVFSDTSSLSTPKMLLAMAQSLGLHTVAVGVENRAQEQCMQQAGCGAFQGFLYCEPLSAADFATYVQGLNQRPGS
jgi:diguanylate cyclase (GGDEF)-like protein